MDIRVNVHRARISGFPELKFEKARAAEITPLFFCRV
jgi:hypothetical protein